MRLRENAALEKPRKQQKGDYYQDDHHQYVNQVGRTHVCISSLVSVCIGCTRQYGEGRPLTQLAETLCTREVPRKAYSPTPIAPGPRRGRLSTETYYVEVSAGFAVEASRGSGRGRAKGLAGRAKTPAPPQMERRNPYPRGGPFKRKGRNLNATNGGAPGP